MVVSKSTLGVLSEKQNSDRGCPGQKVKINDEDKKKIDFIVVSGNYL